MWQLFVLLAWFSSVETHTYSMCNQKYCLFSDANLTHTVEEADTICQSHNAWALEIYNETTNNQLVDLFYKFPMNIREVHLNMKKDTKGWMWLTGKKAENLKIGGQIGGTKKFATLWVNSSGNLFIEAERVDNSNFLICRNISDSCSANSSRCYHVIRDWFDWYKASGTCKSRGMRLATFEKMSQRQLEKFFEEITLEKNRGYWIGLSRGFLRWKQADTIVEYSKWRTVPVLDDTQICPRAFKDGSWDVNWDLNCDRRVQRFVVCMNETVAIPDTTLTPIQNSSQSSQRAKDMKVGVGVGVSVFLLLLVVIVVVLFWRFKPHLFQRSSKTITTSPSPHRSTLPPSYSSVTKDPIYAQTVESAVAPPESVSVAYVELAPFPDSQIKNPSAPPQ